MDESEVSQNESSGKRGPAPQETRKRYSLRPANAADSASLAQLVASGYQEYVARLGMLPRPMTENYAQVVRERQVTVAEVDGTIVGLVVLAVTEAGFLIDNVAVHPLHRGRGLGRLLLQFAEAEALRQGFDSIYLYTHEKMTENLALYSGIDYREYERRSHGDFSLVYMRKSLRSGGYEAESLPLIDLKDHQVDATEVLGVGKQVDNLSRVGYEAEDHAGGPPGAHTAPTDPIQECELCGQRAPGEGLGDGVRPHGSRSTHQCLRRQDLHEARRPDRAV